MKYHEEKIKAVPLPRESKNVLSVSCNFCGCSPKKIIDAPTIHGPWAHMCVTCYQGMASLSAVVVGTTHLNKPREELS